MAKRSPGCVKRGRRSTAALFLYLAARDSCENAAAMSARLFLVLVLVLLSAAISFAQEQGSPPRTDLLTMNGGKPNLSATDDGITSYKTDEIYERGTTRVRRLKPAEVKFKIELPFGYTLFNDLLFAVETDTVVTGPSDITFHLPSARTKEIFAQLRILYAEFDYADPEVPKWIDATLDQTLNPSQPLLSEAAIKDRQRDFKSLTLHAWTDHAPLAFVVALRDPAKVREKLTADLQLTGTATPQVTEGRLVTYELKVTNRGPDTATGIALHSNPTFSFVSVKASQGKCNMLGQNVYCKFPSLEKDRSIDIKIIERCEWSRQRPNDPPEPENTSGIKVITVGSSELDPSYENNQLDLPTEVFRDQNRGPVIEILSPVLFQLFQGPAAAVPIRFKATDPDGFIKKVELFDKHNGTPLGEPALRSDGEYELIYKDAGFGRRWVTIVATDNLGRVASEHAPEFFINGPTKVEITSPKAGTILNRADGDVTVTIHAVSPSSSLKKVSLDIWNSDATAIGNDNYVVKLKSCVRKCRLQAIAIDDNGVESRSEPMEFTIASVPETKMYWHDGEYLREFEPGKPLKVNNEVKLHAGAAHEDTFSEATIVKTQIFVDGVLLCTTDEAARPWHEFNCVWRPSPGKYKLHAVATDEDGAVGKSEVIEVIIERP